MTPSGTRATRPWPPAHPDALDLLEGAVFIGPLILLSLAFNAPRWLACAGRCLLGGREG